LGFNHRGVCFWQKAGKRRILMSTNNSYLWSLNADTGLPDPDFGTKGKVDLTKGLGRQVERKYYSTTAAPMIVGNIIVMGSVVADYPLKHLPPGHVRGFDVETGEQRWIFHTIPQAGEKGVDSWEQESWKYSGGTNVWSLMSADPELGYVYLPVGTPNNDWYGGHRLGDNLFAELQLDGAPASELDEKYVEVFKKDGFEAGLDYSAELGSKFIVPFLQQMAIYFAKF